MSPRRLASLFELPRSRPAFPSLRAELAAVRSGRKPICVETWPAGAERGDPDYAALLASNLDLTEHRLRGRGGAALHAVFAARPGERWRVPALETLWRVFIAAEGAWSDGAEALEASLLGYTPAQIRAWLAARRHARLGWRGVTVYAVVPRARRAGPPRAWIRATLAWAAPPRVIRRRPPAWLARDGLAIARLAIPARTFTALFPGDAPLRSRIAGARDAARLDRGALGRVESLGARGWR